MLKLLYILWRRHCW